MFIPKLEELLNQQHFWLAEQAVRQQKLTMPWAIATNGWAIVEVRFQPYQMYQSVSTDQLVN